MPIGSTNVYNAGDLILSTVSGSGTSFTETKIIAATSSLILFNSSATLTSQSLNSTTVGTSSYVSGSTSIITNLTASNISASSKIQTNQITASSILANNGPLMVTGSNAYIQMFPVGGFPLPTNLTASYIYTSGSTNDLYFTQYSGPYTNTTRLRWLESNLYTGILHGGVLTSTPGSTTFTVTEGEGLIVSLNAFTASAPYPTVKLIQWPTSTQPIIYSGSAKITYVGIDNVGSIVQQTNAWGSSDINQWDNQIELGVVLHLSGSVSTGVFNSPQISYGIPQQTDDFLRAFGPLKISGHTLQASGSTPTLSIKKSGGTAYRDGANYVNNPNHPSTVVENAITSSKIYRYYISGSTPIIDTGVGNAGYTTIDNNNYVNTATGQLDTVGNSNWSIQRVFWIPNSPTNAFIVYYGNATYSTLLNAVNAKDSEPFTESPNTSLNAIFVGYIIIEGGAGRDLLNALECTIIQGGLFRNVGGIGSSGTSPVSTTLAGLSDVALAGLAEGDLLVYGGGQWNNNKTLNGNYTITGSLTVQSGITGDLTGTSSWASNARTASYLTPSNSYTITNLTASTISASGAIIAGSFTGSFSGSIGNAVSAISASYALSASFSSNTISSSYSLTSSFATTAQTANALNTANSYTIAGLTNNGTLSQQGALSMGSGYQLLLTTGTAPTPSLSFVGDTNTGIYSPGADTLGFSISGSERVRIDNNGSVGIGTTSPQYALDVIGNLGVSGTGYFGTITSSNNIQVGSFNAVSTTPAQLVFGNYQTSGTTRPSFIFNGAAQWMGLGQLTASAVNHLRLGVAASPGNNWGAFGATAFNLMIDGGLSLGTTSSLNNGLLVSGSIGIGSGVTTPLGKLHITSSATNGESLVYLSKGSGSITQYYINAVNQNGTLNYRVSSDINGHAQQTLYFAGTAHVYHDSYWSSYINNANYTQGGLGIGTSSVIHGYGLAIARPATSGSLYVSGSSVFTGSVNISGSVTFSGPIIYDNAVLLDYGSTSTPVVSTNYAVLQNLTGSYNSAFFDYFASSGSNFRAGTVIAGWSGSSINYTEYSTTDVGNTNELSMSVDLSGSFVRLLTRVSTTINWNIKSAGRYL